MDTEESVETEPEESLDTSFLQTGEKAAADADADRDSQEVSCDQAPQPTPCWHHSRREKACSTQP